MLSIWIQSGVRSMTLARKGDVAIFGEVCIGFPRMELRRAGHSVELTFLEFKLLKFFICAAERVVSKILRVPSLFPDGT